MGSEGEVNVLLYGLGAIGSFYAFILSRVKNVRLTVIARSNYDAVKADGFTIDSANHGVHKVVPHRVVKIPAEAAGNGEIFFDFVVCAHKAIDQESVPARLAPAVTADRTTIVLIQNGVGIEEPFRKAFPETTILSCVCWVGAIQPRPGFVTHTKSENTQIGLFPTITATHESRDQHRLQHFATLLRQGGTSLDVVADVQVQRWEKVIWNVAWNSLTTLTMQDTHAWLASSAGAVPLTRRLMREVIDVARRACGGDAWSYKLADDLLDKALAMHSIGSSMQTDAKHEREMEVECILGYPVAKAREFGIDVPVLETLYCLLTAVNARFREKK
ncbi:2-dehydropantoate 2-reductase [Xylariaceae sp. FL0594]|nr:2-dehydropantoate 2-reductase [Xylariaceae sp. FL0594]